jgi:hypothetical protein
VRTPRVLGVTRPLVASGRLRCWSLHAAIHQSSTPLPCRVGRRGRRRATRARRSTRRPCVGVQHDESGEHRLRQRYEAGQDVAGVLRSNYNIDPSDDRADRDTVSRYCNTVWTKITNLTQNSMTAQAETSVYNCAAEACFVQKTPKSLDTLPGNGDSSWSVQVDLPPGTTKVGDIMPPTFRSKGWLDIGPATYLKDIGREPVFTQTRGNFDNAIPHRQGTAVLSCDNSQVEEACVTWPKPAGQAWPTLEVRFQASFQMVGVADEHAQMEGIMESWSYASAKSPLLVRCAPCPPLGQEDIIVYGGNLAYAGEALIDGKTNTIPSSATHAFVRFDDSYPFNNDCGAEGAGCANQPSDYRLFLSHELGHALALTHCDLDFGVMCRITDENGNDGTFGTGFWTPQIREVWALEAMYP